MDNETTTTTGGSGQACRGFVWKKERKRTWPSRIMLSKNPCQFSKKTTVHNQKWGKKEASLYKKKNGELKDKNSDPLPRCSLSFQKLTFCSRRRHRETESLA